MGQTVYVDLLFLINFSMDFLCFFLSSKILNLKLSLGRVAAASAIGGIYADIALFISAPKLASLAIDIAVCILMCMIAILKKGRGKSIPLFVLVYFAVSMALGGFMTAIFNLLNKAELPLGDSTNSSDGISVWMFAILAGISAVITLISGRFFRKKSTQKTARIEIKYDGKSVSLGGMSDSGNLLREPISGRPCIVADIDALGSIIPERVRKAAKNKDIGIIESLSQKDARRVRIVPIRTAGGEGSLIALRADSITVDCGGGAREVDAFIALSELDKSADGMGALIPIELML